MTKDERREHRELTISHGKKMADDCHKVRIGRIVINLCNDLKPFGAINDFEKVMIAEELVKRGWRKS